MLAWIVLAVGVVASLGLSLHFTRETTYYVDEVTFFQSSDGFAPRDLLEPFNGHLIALPRAIYAASFALFGPSYLPFRIVQAVGVALAAVLFYILARRRVGAVALAPALILLFFGSSWDTTLTPIGFPLVWSIAAGLGALVALEAGDRRGDICACLLLTAAAATHSTGLPYVAAALVAVLLARDRWRRIWVIAIPALLYGAWTLAKTSLEGSFSGLQASPEVGNLVHVPWFFSNSAAAVASAITGLNYDSHPAVIPSNTDPLFGAILAGICVAAVAFRMIRRNVGAGLWVAIALLAVVWLTYTLVSSIARTPEASRYLYPGAVAVLLVGVEALRGARLNRFAVLAIAAITAVSVGFNVAHLRQGGSWLRTYSSNARSQFTAIDLARDRVDPDFALASGFSFYLGIRPGSYLAAVDRTGSPGFSVSELSEQSEFDRQSADGTVAAAIGVRLTAARGRSEPLRCRRVMAATDGAPVTFTVKSPGVILRSPGTADVSVGRFGSPSYPVGSLTANRPRYLLIPADRSSRPWTVSVGSKAGAVAVCERPGGR